VNINGSAVLYKVKCKELSVNGSLNFDEVTAYDRITINGAVEGSGLHAENITISGGINAKQITANNLYISGAANISEVKVTEVFKSLGSLTIANSNFKAMEIGGMHATLENVKAANIIVTAEDNKSRKLILKGDTEISGDIRFQYEGEVHILDRAKVNGSIIGARVIKK
jgi:cytoskeletal protein CcmA (bactofilin family)